MAKPRHWQAGGLLALLLLGLLYALPNLYGEDLAVEIWPDPQRNARDVPRDRLETHVRTVVATLPGDRPIPVCTVVQSSVICRCADPESQLATQALLARKLGPDYSIALALRPRVPAWMQALGALPMRLGLDLRGGLHLVLKVDTVAAMARDGLSSDPVREQAIMEQTLDILQRRVNALGISEAGLHRQGPRQIAIDLPGIQDPARAKSVLGKTATLEFVLRDPDLSGDAALQAVLAGKRSLPLTTQLARTRHGRWVILQKKQVLRGEAITGATVGSDADGRPAVLVRVAGPEVAAFRQATERNVGAQMAVLYHEVGADGALESSVVSLATIQSGLGAQFQITGLSRAEAVDLAILLRSGALPATIRVVEERHIGPSLGLENIRLGVRSMYVGIGLVWGFMAWYYGVFGWIANIGLCCNVIFLVALLSVLGATLTLPGIAGIVLTVGMAVDANVLIFERIREELRRGLSAAASIRRGFEQAWGTIVDANVTTFLVGILLFGIGSGPIRGFALTLCVGIVTSVFTAVTVTRWCIDIGYGHRRLKRVPIGIPNGADHGVL